ncbi:YihY/virulence factor BrkB family protein [Terriglobus tenax]|uniref:YihY/virulence factor BrkB family protein n=1 Tax=Terriglobus tenax TaxID=1111115 RepID=UPI0021E01514|nr:YihY/virulence factor BrkB family protein [Terriglobus tenax]
MRRFWAHLRLAARNGFHHDVFGTAKGCAYSAIFALFPALIVTAAVIARMPDGSLFRQQFSLVFVRVFPPQVTALLASYFPHVDRAGASLPIGASIVSLTGASGVLLTLMEGFRRAYDLPQGVWGFWKRRIISFVLVPISVLPLGLASVLVVFGHYFALWLYILSPYYSRDLIYVVATAARWIIALAGTVSIVSFIYHFGTPRSVSWRRTLPGALFATLLWFASTLAFGWYVTHYANYSRVYGSLGAGIALLVWLYLASISVMFGAELNAARQLHTSRRRSGSLLRRR